jgi:hypothetical protein
MAGTRNVLLEGDHISGQWATAAVIYRIDKAHAIALDLLNTPHVGKRSYADAALDFTKKFGPLTIPFSRGASFRFSISEWKETRQNLHIAWKVASSAAKWNQPFYLPLDGDHFSFEKGRITFRTQKLITYAALEIASISAQRLRRCANFGYGCKSPFYFASDLRERYCSQMCANEAKKRAKLRWWNENRKGEEDGTQKAR